MQTDEEPIQEEKSIQTKDQQIVGEKRARTMTKMKQRKAQYVLLGIDSKVKNIPVHVKCTMKGSGCNSLRGA